MKKMAPLQSIYNEGRKIMKKLMKKIISGALIMASMLMLVACGVTETPSVNFGFKVIDGAGAFDESITSFEVGKKFYSCITIKLVTDKKKARDYQVVIEIPKTKEVEVKGMGGLEPDSIEWDEAQELTRMTFTVQGYREATDEKILFYGTPTDEGEAKITVHIYDEDGNEINAGYSRTIFFEYTLQE